MSTWVGVGVQSPREVSSWGILDVLVSLLVLGMVAAGPSCALFNRICPPPKPVPADSISSEGLLGQRGNTGLESRGARGAGDSVAGGRCEPQRGEHVVDGLPGGTPGESGRARPRASDDLRAQREVPFPP